MKVLEKLSDALDKICGALIVVMIGAMCRLFGFDKAKMRQAVSDCVPEKFAEINLAAFDLGYNRVKK